MNKYQHTSVILHFEEKDFATSREDLLQGLTKESTSALADLGRDGWELVSVLPYVSPSVRLMRQPGTDAAVGFFKRLAA